MWFTQISMSRKYSGRTDALCCSQSFAFASFISKNPSSLSAKLTIELLQNTRSAESHWLQPHLVTCPRNDLWNRALDWGSTVTSLLTLLRSIFTCISCAFSTTYTSWVQILRNSSHHHIILILGCFWTFVQNACGHTGISGWSGRWI